ncbi:hypothetical protein B3C1_02790 [Gallaecimonas xiamenensis 3-C-1]|uniref:Uncharacterized protein n=1 Tax=Gallaecimonas xiamenensis 3-C-1 TaxID=745411 RepID=K2JRH6_9GAMM|nr:hypothetical protein B3C1_02790 [Gallaecimonas xiamenensis 3-C-1]
MLMKRLRFLLATGWPGIAITVPAGDQFQQIEKMQLYRTTAAEQPLSPTYFLSAKTGTGKGAAL